MQKQREIYDDDDDEVIGAAAPPDEAVLMAAEAQAPDLDAEHHIRELNHSPQDASSLFNDEPLTTPESDEDGDCPCDGNIAMASVNSARDGVESGGYGGRGAGRGWGLSSDGDDEEEHGVEDRKPERTRLSGRVHLWNSG